MEYSNQTKLRGTENGLSCYGVLKPNKTEENWKRTIMLWSTQTKQNWGELKTDYHAMEYSNQTKLRKTEKLLLCYGVLKPNKTEGNWKLTIMLWGTRTKQNWGELKTDYHAMEYSNLT